MFSTSCHEPPLKTCSNPLNLRNSIACPLLTPAAQHNTKGCIFFNASIFSGIKFKGIFIEPSNLELENSPLVLTAQIEVSLLLSISVKFIISYYLVN